MSKNVNRRLRKLADPRLCLGCGACAYICPDNRVEMIDIEAVGLRPRFTGDFKDTEIQELLDVCPTVQADYQELKSRSDYRSSIDKDAEKDWGAITGIWEGFSCDEEIRLKGSSGGVLSAISLYCIEVLGFGGVLHTGMDPRDPLRNSNRMSKNRSEILKSVGSRYSPTAVCEGFGLIESSSDKCVFIGKPVEVAAARNAMKLRSQLQEKIGVTLSFFCAETPPTLATKILAENYDVDLTSLTGLRYRGYGWPGYFSTETSKSDMKEHLIYHDAWAFLQSYRPWAAHMWPDGSGELADISCGDPWYEMPDGKNPGFSLIVARTKLGREIVEGAIAAGYLHASVAELWKLDQSQKGLLDKKGAIWGRRLAHSVLLLRKPKYKGIKLFHAWMRLSVMDKLRSVFGTLRRLIQRGLWRLDWFF